MKKIAKILIGLATLATFSVPVLASSATTKRVPVTHIVKVPVWRVVHGKKVHVWHRVDGKRVETFTRKREDVRVWRRERIKVRVKVDGKWKVETRIVRRKVIETKIVTVPPPTTTTQPVTTTTTTQPVTTTTTTQPVTTTTVPATTTTTAATSTPAKIVVKGSTDPTATIAVTTPQAPPVPITFDYSASVSSGDLPDGVITFTVEASGSLSATATCSTTVVSATTSTVDGSCTKNIPGWGNYDLITNYSSGLGTVATTATTETVDIEPPSLAAITNPDYWPAPTGSITITDSTHATATISSSNYEGATAVTLKDQLGDQCSASVSGSSASCTLPLSGPPTSLSVGYPGGVSTTTTEYSSAWGVSEPQSVTTSWPAETVSGGSSVSKAAQTVSFTSSGGTPVTGTTYSPTASSTSGGAPTFTGSGDCSGTGTITMAATSGTCTVTANQAGNGYYTAASATQSFYVHTVTTVTETISSIQALTNFSNPCGTLTNSGGYQCVEMGVVLSTTAPSGTVTLTATAANSTHSNNETASCTVDLSSATTCYALFDSETGLPTLTSGSWSIAASYGGTSTTDSNGNITNYSTASLNPTMSTVNSGSWFSYQGS